MALDKTFSSGEVLSAADVNNYLRSLWIPLDKRVITSGSPVSSVSFASIDSNYHAFRLTLNVLPSSAAEFALRFNNDTGTNYQALMVWTSGGASSVLNNNAVNLMDLGIGGASQTTATLTIGKHVAAQPAAVSGTIAAVSGSTYLMSLAGKWANTSALINRIDVITKSSTFYGLVGLEGMRSV